MAKELNELNELKMVSIRLVDDPPLYSDTPIQSPDDAVELLGDEMRRYDREILSILNLNAQGQVINASIVSMGALTNAIVEPREIFKPAILANAASIIMMHNHPSGNPEPSREDYMVTNRIYQCGDMMEINLLDHIIVGKQGQYYSFLEHDELSLQNTEKGNNQRNAAENSQSAEEPETEYAEGRPR